MKNVVPFLAGVVIGILAVVLLVRVKGPRILGFPPTSLPNPICEATIKLTLKKNPTTGVPEDIIVDPMHPVCVALTRPVNWDIGDPDVKLVRIEFKRDPNQPPDQPLGPFPANATLLNDDYSPINKDRGIYLPNKAGRVTAKMADTTGSYKYWVEWTTTNNIKLTTPDPVVCIRD